MGDGNSENGFDFGDAVFVGGAIGMAHELIEGEEQDSDYEYHKDDDNYDTPSTKDAKLVQRLDPELHNMVVDVLREQQAKRIKRIKAQQMREEEAAILAEAAEFERILDEDV